MTVNQTLKDGEDKLPSFEILFDALHSFVVEMGKPCLILLQRIFRLKCIKFMTHTDDIFYRTIFSKEVRFLFKKWLSLFFLE